MTEIVAKAELLDKMQAGYDQLEALPAPLSDAQMTTPNVNGPWSIKDNLAHLTAWQERLLTLLQSAVTDSAPPAFVPGTTTEDEINERIYQQQKARPLDAIHADFRASYQRVVAAIQGMSAATLNAPLTWTTDGIPIWPLIVGNTFGHYEEHGDIIRRWLAGA